MKQPTPRVVEVELHDQTFRCYQAAVRRIQRHLGDDAPTVEELFGYELSYRRTVRSIYDDYMESRRRRSTCQR